MIKKAFAYFTSIVMLITIFSVGALGAVNNPDTLTQVVIGNQNTLDPHYAWDSSSSEVVFQIYETLIRYKGESVSEFEPLLASEVPSQENGLISKDGLTYVFPIREGIKFSNGNSLTSEDIEYSFERAMILDRTSGPSWMFLEPLVGVSTLDELAEKLVGVKEVNDLNPEQAKKVFDRIDKAVEVNGNNVIFHLKTPYPPFLGIVSATWASIIDKEWTIKQGGWDGNGETIAKYHDPTKEDDPLYSNTMGTGPFILNEWVNGDHLILQRNDRYWREKANFKTVIVKNINEWSTRKLMLQRGDADIVYVPKEYLFQVKNTEGVRVIENLPTLSTLTMALTWEVDPRGNENIGSGKLDGKGIPFDFFSDIHVRKAFSYAFDYNTFIEQVRKGSDLRMRGPFLQSIMGYDENSLVYEYDLDKAKEEFKKAFNGELWKKGFKMTFAYNTGNSTRKLANDILKSAIESLNPKFKVEVRGLQWSSFLEQELKHQLPLAVPGWAGDFADPHNFAVAFLASDGRMAAQRGPAFSEWAKTHTDPLIEKGLKTQSQEERIKIYKELQQISYENAIDIFISQPLQHYVGRTWVKGYYNNPMYNLVDFYKLDK